MDVENKLMVTRDKGGEGEQGDWGCYIHITIQNRACCIALGTPLNTL